MTKDEQIIHTTKGKEIKRRLSWPVGLSTLFKSLGLPLRKYNGTIQSSDQQVMFVKKCDNIPWSRFFLFASSQGGHHHHYNYTIGNNRTGHLQEYGCDNRRNNSVLPLEIKKGAHRCNTIVYMQFLYWWIARPVVPDIWNMLYTWISILTCWEKKNRL